MSAIHEVLRHLIHSGPARNEAELARLVKLVDEHEAATTPRPAPPAPPAPEGEQQ